MRIGTLLVLALGAASLAAWPARDGAAEEGVVVQVRIKDHHFTPSEIHVPSRTPVRLEITNEDPTAEELDSHALKVEKVIAGRKSGSVRIRPLEPGRYPFVGEFHEDVARGVIVAD